MTDELDTAARYRQRAEDLRIIAAEDRSRANSSALLKIAEDYERMAESLEAIHHTNEVIHRAKD